jgi:hypothetical protein
LVTLKSLFKLALGSTFTSLFQNSAKNSVGEGGRERRDEEERRSVEGLARRGRAGAVTCRENATQREKMAKARFG